MLETFQSPLPNVIFAKPTSVCALHSILLFKGDTVLVTRIQPKISELAEYTRLYRQKVCVKKPPATHLHSVPRVLKAAPKCVQSYEHERYYMLTSRTFETECGSVNGTYSSH